MIIAAITLLLGIVVLLSIIAANGYFVAQEFAYMSVDRARLAARAESGDAAAERALKVTKRTILVVLLQYDACLCWFLQQFATLRSQRCWWMVGPDGIRFARQLSTGFR